MFDGQETITITREEYEQQKASEYQKGYEDGYKQLKTIKEKYDCLLKGIDAIVNIAKE